MSNPNPFKNEFALNIFKNKYAQGPADTWFALSERLIEDVCGTRNGTEQQLMSNEDLATLTQFVKEMKFIPGGRYLYYAGRPFKAYNNCYLLRGEEDTREEWASLFQRASSCLLTGGGIGIDYSIFREKGKALRRTGGQASGPIPLMSAINEIGRNVMQGGSRRSAIYASLNWRHPDVGDFLKVKDWAHMPVGNTGATLAEIKEQDFNFPCPLDMTNISLNYDDAWLDKKDRHLDPTFLANCRQALMTGEPGFSFNFGDKQNETLRNALH